MKQQSTGSSDRINNSSSGTGNSGRKLTESAMAKNKKYQLDQYQETVMVVSAPLAAAQYSKE